MTVCKNQCENIVRVWEPLEELRGCSCCQLRPTPASHGATLKMPFHFVTTFLMFPELCMLARVGGSSLRETSRELRKPICRSLHPTISSTSYCRQGPGDSGLHRATLPPPLEQPQGPPSFRRQHHRLCCAGSSSPKEVTFLKSCQDTAAKGAKPSRVVDSSGTTAHMGRNPKKPPAEP